MWQSVTLATRAAVLVGSLFAMGLVIVGAYALQVFESRYLALVGAHQQAMLEAQANRLDDKFDITKSVLAGIGRTPEANLMNDHQALQRFVDTRVFLHLSFDRGVRVYDRNGRMVVQSPVNGTAPVPIDIEQELVSDALATGKTHTSRPFVVDPSSTQPLLAMSSAVVDDKGQVVGALLGSLHLLSKQYAADLQTHKFGEAGYLFMTTRDRVMVMHPDPLRILQTAAARGQNEGYDRAADSGFEGTIETINSTGQNVLASFVRIRSMDWILGAYFPMAEATLPFDRALDALLGVALAAGALLTFGVAAMVHRLMQPVRALSRHLIELGEGRARPFVEPSAGEMKALSGAYNKMLLQLESSEAARREGEQHVMQLNETLEQRVRDRTLALEKANAELNDMLQRNAHIQEELVRSEKLAALGRLMAGLAHELNTPLGNALTVSSAMRDASARFNQKVQNAVLKRSELERFNAYCLDVCALIERNLTRTSNLIRSVKQAAVDQTAERRRKFDLSETIGEVLATVKHLVRHRPLQLHLNLAPGLEMDSFPGAMGQVATNLFTNVLDHAFGPDDAGDIWIECQAAEEDSVRLVVRDNGRGIDAEDLGKIFDPFFTTRLGQGGSGLGLYIVHNAVTGPLGGRIEVRSEVGKGTSFVATLPRTAPLPTAPHVL